MTAPQGILRVHQDERTITFQVEGQATVLQGLPLRRLAEKYLADGATCLRVDLRRCTWLDSTFVGTLLLLFRTVASQKTGEFCLLSPSPECRRVLHQMGVDRICTLRDVELPTTGWSEVEQTKEASGEYRFKVLEAHQELAELPGPTGEAFRQVVRCVTDSQRGGSAH